MKWIDVLKYANQGSPASDKCVVKSDEEWKKLLTNEQYHITRKKAESLKQKAKSLCYLTFSFMLYALSFLT